MQLPLPIETATATTLLNLPERVQKVLAGRPVVLDGQTLAPETQLMLRLMRVARMPAAEEQSIPEGRRIIDRQAALLAGQQPIGTVRTFTLAGRRARMYTPTSFRGGPAPLLVFFHGGGFVYGGLDSHDASCRLVAETSGVRVLAIDYRLAPEAPFPAAYDDCLAAYEYVVDHAAELDVDLDRIAVGGDSAGGNLAAGVAIAAAKAKKPLAWQLLVYPATDNKRATRSLELFSEGFFLTRTFMEVATENYLPREEDRLDPRASPLYADLPRGLAPAYVVTAGFDPLRDEGEAYSRKLAEAGVVVELQRFPDQIHGFFNVVGAGRRSRAAVIEIAGKLREALVKQ